jgi:hypothetical protein
MNFLEEKDKAVAEEEARLQEGRDRRASKREESIKLGLSIWADVIGARLEIDRLKGEQVALVLLYKGATIPKGCTKVQQKRELITTLYGEEVEASRAASSAVSNAATL